jgi:hypothetical membrane protein
MRASGKQADLRLGMVRVVGVTMALFSLALAAAVAVYPGHDAAARGYRFCYDFISALGVTRTPGGHDNRLSCWIFNTALGLAMLTLIPYWHVRARHVRGPRAMKALAFLCCAGFSLGVLGVALCPYDVRPDAHNICIYSAFALIVPGVLLVLLGSDRALAGWRYRAGWAVFAVALLLCEGVLSTLVAHHVLPSRPVNPVLQKVNVAVFFAWMVTDLWLFSAFLRQRKQALA